LNNQDQINILALHTLNQISVIKLIRSTYWYHSAIYESGVDIDPAVQKLENSRLQQRTA